MAEDEYDDEFDEIITEFTVECGEWLDEMEADLVKLEQDPTAPDQLNRIFRVVHTIKGTAGSLGFARITELSHVGESVLDRLRAGEDVAGAATIDALLELLDAMRRILASIEKDRTEPEERFEAVEATLRQILSRDPGAAVGAVVPADAVTPIPEVRSPSLSAPIVDEGSDSPQTELSDGTLRVSVDVLDALMNLVGELVLTRNQLVDTVASESQPTAEAAGGLGAAIGQLSTTTSLLQRAVMQTRMQPIGALWTKLPRVLRDAAKASGKDARLEMAGTNTELDKTLVDAVRDPLTHLIRNAVDHGLEAPDERVRLGKPRTGTVLLAALHQGGKMVIEVRDDGAGIDPDAVRATAVKRGLLDEDAAAALSDERVSSLLFEPGFSTAASVSQTSGRGVGLDVVRDRIERIGGSVEVETARGEGTVFRLRIPLTLAIVPALIVRAADAPYAIPQSALRELVWLPAESVGKIERVYGAPVYRLREQLLPLIDLQEVLELHSGSSRPPRDVYIVVVELNGQLLGVMVDDVVDTKEIVIKPIGSLFDDLGVYAGATVLGDGSIALVLDVAGIARRGHATRAGQDRAEKASIDQVGAAAAPRGQMLLIRTPDDGRMAFPLATVVRLEEFAADDVERAGGREVIQYRETVLPLARLSELLSERRATRRSGVHDSVGGGRIQVVLLSRGSRRVGVVVDEILDIESEPEAPLDEATRPGVLGTAIIGGRVTEVLDVEAVMLTDARSERSR